MQHKPKWEKENLKDGVWDSAHQRKSKKNHHPRVKTVASSEVCNYAVNRLKAGPPNVPKIIADGVAWKDSTFTGTDTIYWDNGATATKKSTYDTKLADTVQAVSNSRDGLNITKQPRSLTVLILLLILNQDKVEPVPAISFRPCLA